MTTLEPRGEPLGRSRIGWFRGVGEFDQPHRLLPTRLDLLDRLLDRGLLMGQIGIDELTIGMNAFTINEAAALQFPGMPERIKELRMRPLDLNQGDTKLKGGERSQGGR